MMGYHYRFNDLIHNLKEITDKGSLGKIKTATAFVVGSRPPQEWWFDPEKAGGGALLDIGCHVVDLMLWFFGKASLRYSYVDFRSHLPTEDYALLLMDFKNGTKAIIHTGYFSQAVRYGLTLCGTANSASTEDFRSSLVSYALKGATRNLIKRFVGKPIVPLGHLAAAIFKEMQHFVYCIEEDVQPMVTGEDGLKSLEIILQAYQSAKTERRIDPLCAHAHIQ
jgi:predicted dehydrogenase